MGGEGGGAGGKGRAAGQTPLPALGSSFAALGRKLRERKEENSYSRRPPSRVPLPWLHLGCVSETCICSQHAAWVQASTVMPLGSLSQPTFRAGGNPSHVLVRHFSRSKPSGPLPPPYRDGAP